jgi:hypothetical protein
VKANGAPIESLPRALAREPEETAAQAHRFDAVRALRSARGAMDPSRTALGGAVHFSSHADASDVGGESREAPSPRLIRFDVEHSVSGALRACEYVECLAAPATRSRARARAVAKAIVLRWPSGGGLAVFCLASGWDLTVRRSPWRLSGEARARARCFAVDEGLRLPLPCESPPFWEVAQPAAPRIERVIEDPRQGRLPF